MKLKVVVVESRVAVRALKRACKNRDPDDKLIGMTPDKFRKVFDAMRSYFEVKGRLTPYSIRRGGASWYFLSSNSMERTMLRGRWSSLNAAKYYVSESLAASVALKLTKRQIQLIAKYVQPL